MALTRPDKFKKDNVIRIVPRTGTGTIQGSSMTLTGPDNVVSVVPPVADDKGEFTEVQVLEEGDVFDPDRFLDQLEKHQPTARRECPLCLVPLKFGGVKQRNGNIFKYYRCPNTSYHKVSRKTSKCFITCAAHEVDQYLELARKQIHPCYREMDMISFQCKYHKPLVLTTSHEGTQMTSTVSISSRCDFWFAVADSVIIRRLRFQSYVISLSVGIWTRLCYFN